MRAAPTAARSTRRSAAPTRYLEAGADLAFVEGPTSVDEIARVCREVRGPVFYNQTGVSPRLTPDQMKELGIAVTILPGATLRVALQAIWDFAAALRAEGPAAEARFAERFKDHPVGDLHTFAGLRSDPGLGSRVLAGRGAGEVPGVGRAPAHPSLKVLRGDGAPGGSSTLGVGMADEAEEQAAGPAAGGVGDLRPRRCRPAPDLRLDAARAGAIRSTQAQVSLGLALAVALLGFWMFRSLLGRMGKVVQALAAALDQASRLRRAPAPAPGLGVALPVPAVAAGAAAPADGGQGATAGAAFAAPAPAAPSAPATGAPHPAARQGGHEIAGIGKIRELTEVVATMDALWYREATAHVGHRVQISVANRPDPLTGALIEATPDGLILEQPDGPVPIAYGRVTAIDRLH